MKKCVLLLEDNDDLRELITYLLEEEDLQVSAYPTIESFHRGIKEKVPDIFIFDIQLPDGNGVDICKETKADPHTKDIPVILMSAHMQGKLLSDSCNAEDFIAKPFDILDFITKVKYYIND